MSDMTFEQKMEQLETLIKQLESGDNSLDDSVKLYQKGIVLAKECHQELETAEKTILELRTEDGLETFEK